MADYDFSGLDDVLAKTPTAPVAPPVPVSAPEAAQPTYDFSSLDTPNDQAASAAKAAALFEASFRNPTEEAKKRNLSDTIQRMSGEFVPPAVMDVGDAQRQADRLAADHATRASPRTSAFLSVQENANIAMQDAKVMAQIEASAKHLLRGAVGLPGQITSMAGAVMDVFPNPTGLHSELSSMGRDWKKGVNTLIPEPAAAKSVLSEGWMSGMESLGMNVPLILGAAALTGPAAPATALGLMAVASGGASVQKAQDAGAGAWRTLGLGTADAVAEYVTEKIGIKYLMDIPGLKNAFLKTAAKFAGAEMAGEQVATVWQDFNEWALLNPTKTLRAFGDERGHAAAVTAIATIVGGGGQVAIMKGASALMQSNLDKGTAETFGARLSEMAALTAQLETTRLHMPTAQAFWQEIAGDSSVFIDQAKLTETLAEAGVDVSVLPTAAAQMAEARPEGIEIPVSELMTGLANTKAADAIIQHVRMAPDAESVFEHNQPIDKQLEFFQQEATRAVAAETRTAAFNAEVKQIEDDITADLTTVGAYGKQASATQAKVAGAWYATVADKWGVTPLQIRDGWTAADGTKYPGWRPKIKGAPMQGFSHGQAMLNVGLDVGATDRAQKIDADFVKAEIENLGVKVLSGRNVPGEYELNGRMVKELTYVPRLSRPLTEAEVNQLAAATGQEAIGHYAGGKGDLWGPMAANWGSFNPEFFKDQMGATLLGEQSALAAQQGGLEQHPTTTAAFDYVAKNERQLIDEYFARFGNTIDPDNVKRLFAGYEADKATAPLVHEPSSVLAKKIFTEALKRNAGKPVVFTAGGGGSGKSETLSAARNGADTLVYDSTLSSFASAKARIDEALASGASVRVVYANRPVEAAFQFAMRRARVVPLSVLATAHIGASDTLRALAEHYAGNPDVALQVANNQGDKAEIVAGSIVDVPKYEYAVVERNLHGLAEKALADGTISAEKYAALTVPEASGRGPQSRDSGLQQGERGQDVAGTAGRPGAVPGPVVGIHFSKEPRGILASSMWGTGMKGAEGDYVRAAKDKRLRHRIAFYVNTGNGITPESGVGGQAHVATLTNLYDADADALKIWRDNDDERARESAVLDAGFDGFLTRNFGSQGAVVLLGQRAVEVEHMGGYARTAWDIPKALQKEAIAAGNAVNTGKHINDLQSGFNDAGPEAQAATLAKVLEGFGKPNDAETVAGFLEGRTGTEALSAILAEQDVQKAVQDRAAVVPPAALPPAKQAAQALMANKQLISGQQNVAGWQKDVARIAPDIADQIDWSKLDSGKLYRKDDIAKTLWAMADGTKKGSFSPASLDLRLLADADLSTFLHESSHFFLAAYTDMAAQPGAPKALVDEVNAILAHLFSTVQGGAVAGGDLAQGVGAGETTYKAVDIESPEFKAWFGDSKVVDADGKPLRVFHGTGANDITEFQTSATVDGAFHFGTYEAANDRIDQQYGMEEEDIFIPNNIPVYLHAERLRRVDDQGGDIDAWSEQVYLAKQQGFDGLVYRNEHEGDGDSYVVFSPTQIKSAISNTGAFKGPNILEQNGEVPAPGPLPEGATPLEIWSKMSLDQQRPYHEAWAEQGEQYFMTGKAPSLALESAFRTFANWLKRIYGSLKEFVASHGGAARATGELAQQGRTLKAVDIASPEFKAWAKGLPVATNKFTPGEGVVLKAFHGTQSDIDTFDPTVRKDSRTIAARLHDTLARLGLRDARSALLNDPLDAMLGTAAGQPQAVVQAYGGKIPSLDQLDSNALFFTNSTELSNEYATGILDSAEPGRSAVPVLGGAVVYPVYLRMERPVVVQFGNDKLLLPDGTTVSLKGAADTWYAANAIGLAFAKKMGADGVVLRRVFDNPVPRPQGWTQYNKLPHSDVYIVFAPNQIKSAVSNTGEYSRENDSILHAGGQGAGIALHPDTAAFFDRMLATEAEIKLANEKRGFMQLFKDAAEAGMTERGFADYTALTDEQREDAEAMLRTRSLRDMKWLQASRDKVIAALQSDAKEARAILRAEVSKELAATPLRKAIRWLKTGEMTAPGGDTIKVLEGNKLQKADVEALFPPGALADRPDLSRLRGMTAAEGLAPDLVAEMFDGFTSGEDLVRQLAAAPKFNDEVEALTNQRMLEEHSDLVDPDAIAKAADAAIHNDAHIRLAATELAALNSRIGSVAALTRAAKEYARQLIETKTSKTLKPWQFAAADTRARKAAAKALRKGERDEAATQMRTALVNAAATKLAYDAEDDIKKITDRFKKIAGYKDTDSAFKSRDAELVNAVRAILADFGIGTKGKSAREYLAVVQQHNPDLASVLSDTIDAVTENAKDWQQLKISELRDLAEEIDGLWFLAKRSKQIEIDGKVMPLHEAQQALYDRLDAIGIPDRVPGEGSAVTPAEKRGILFDRFVGALRRVEAWVGAKDGTLTGPFRTYMWNPIRDAADAYRADKAKYLKAYRDLLTPIAPTLTRRLIEAPELGYTFGKDDGGMGKAELLHAILHTGNESNKRKLLLGRGWATATENSFDTSKWDAFVQRMHDEGVLTKADYDFAQGAWNLLDSMKPLAQKAHRDVFGKYFAEVTANEFTNQFGTYAGGYVPAMTDPLIVRDAELNKLREGEEGNMAYAFPTTAKGFTKSRVEYNRPLKLDLRTLSQHIDKVLLFGHMTRPVNDVRRVMSGKSVAQALGRVDPQAYNTLIMPWLNRAAKQVVETPTPGREGLGRFWSVVRARAGMAAMFANVANSAQQITGLSLAAVRVRPALLLDAMAKYAASPSTFAEHVTSKSSYMATRLENEVSMLSDQINDILLNPSIYESVKNWTNKHAYFMQSAVDSVISPVVWLGGYNQAIEAGMSETDAVRAGDSAVRETQGSQAPEDVAAFETGSAFYRMFVQFAGYFNMNANLLGTEFVKLSRDMGLKKGAGRGLYLLTLGFLAPAVVGELIIQLFRGGPDDDDKDGEYLDDWLMALFGYAPLRYATAMVPGVGPAVNATVNTLNNKPYDDRISTAPAISMIEAAAKAPIDLYKAIVEEGKPSKAVKEIATLISMTVGVPASAAAKPVAYLTDVATDRVAPTSIPDAVRGTITGTASPASKQ